MRATLCRQLEKMAREIADAYAPVLHDSLHHCTDCYAKPLPVAADMAHEIGCRWKELTDLLDRIDKEREAERERKQKEKQDNG